MGKHLASIMFLEKENAALTKLVAELRAELALLRKMFAIKENILQ